jgi:hypothetical protein
MNHKDLLKEFVQEHQAREVELRRLQNCVAAESPRAYIGLVDYTYNDDEDPPDVGCHFGTFPVSDQAPSNWHPANDHPFVLARADNPLLMPSNGEILDVWFTFKVTSDQGYCFIDPDGHRAFVPWGKVEGSIDGSIVFCSFWSEEKAKRWVSKRLTIRAPELPSRPSRAAHCGVCLGGRF